MYSNRDRLESALRVVTHRVGMDGLDKPDRLRVLLVDEYGDDGRGDLADVDVFMTSISGGTQDLVNASEPAEIAADRLRKRAEIPFGDAIWTVALIRSIVHPPTGVTETEVPLRIVPYVAGADLSEEPSVQPLTASARAPRRLAEARRTVAVLAIVMSIIAAGAAVWAVRARSDAADLHDELAVVRGTELAGARAEVDALKGQLSDAQGHTTNLQATVDSLTGQLSDAKSQAAKVQSQLITANSSLFAANTAATQAQADLTTARDEITRLGTAFDVDVAAIRPPTYTFNGTLDLLKCSGYRGGCVATSGFGGHFIRSGTDVSFEWPGYVLIPLTTLDGFTYTGEAPVADEYRDNCNGRPKPTTTMILSFSPTHYKVDAGDQSVLATSLNVTWTRLSPAALGCVASSVTYQGSIG